MQDKSRSVLDSSDRSISKYKRKIKDLEKEVDLIRRSTDALNRSRDFSLDMDQHNEDKIATLTS